MSVDQPETRTLTVIQGTPAWAFQAALQALEALSARGVKAATVTLYSDGSGELRIPKRELPSLAERLTPEELFDLVGSQRLDPFEGEDLVIRQCQGFAFRELASE